MENLLELKNVFKIFKNGDEKTIALNDINLDIKKGEILVILGASGSGKTTMLNCLSGLDKITSGTIIYENKNINTYSNRKLTKFRRDNLGFIFQSYNLLENINVYENVLIGSNLSKVKVDVDKIIDAVGLTKHKHKRIFELSGGEAQRVAIARALAKNPKIMFCDEPTGALDEKTGKKVLETLVKINQDFKTTLIIITHNPGIALIGDRVIKMNSGIIKEIHNNEKREDPNLIPWG